MSAIMARKKKTGTDNMQPVSIDPISFRPDDPRVVEVLDNLARANRRTRSATINIIIEESLKAAGLWPPKD